MEQITEEKFREIIRGELGSDVRELKEQTRQNAIAIQENSVAIRENTKDIHELKELTRQNTQDIIELKDHTLQNTVAIRGLDERTHRQGALWADNNAMLRMMLEMLAPLVPKVSKHEESIGTLKEQVDVIGHAVKAHIADKTIHGPKK
jgi:hypothetical protein